MPGRGVVTSPVIVGRDEVLALADRRLEEPRLADGDCSSCQARPASGRLACLRRSRAERNRNVWVMRAEAFPK